jgi:hypothetical protein
MQKRSSNVLKDNLRLHAALIMNASFCELQNSLCSCPDFASSDGTTGVLVVVAAPYSICPYMCTGMQVGAILDAKHTSVLFLCEYQVGY